MSNLITYSKPKSPISEVFRTLRTNIQFMNINKKLKVLLVTSANAGEGKSWVTSNLATTFAQAKKNVLIVDADMRKGRQFEIFELAKRPGLSDLLANIDEDSLKKDYIEKFIQKTEVENLSVMPAGSIPPNPSELLDSVQMLELIKTLKDMYDMVVVDGTPCELVTDSVILSRMCDSTIVVAEYNKTTKQSLEKTVKNIQNVNGKIAGIVLNKVPINKKKYESSYYYGASDKEHKKGNENLSNNKNKEEKDMPRVKEKPAIIQQAEATYQVPKIEEKNDAIYSQSNVQESSQVYAAYNMQNVQQQGNAYIYQPQLAYNNTQGQPMVSYINQGNSLYQVRNIQQPIVSEYNMQSQMAQPAVINNMQSQMTQPAVIEKNQLENEKNSNIEVNNIEPKLTENKNGQINLFESKEEKIDLLKQIASVEEKLEAQKLEEESKKATEAFEKSECAQEKSNFNIIEKNNEEIMANKVTMIDFTNPIKSYVINNNQRAEYDELPYTFEKRPELIQNESERHQVIINNSDDEVTEIKYNLKDIIEQVNEAGYVSKNK